MLKSYLAIIDSNGLRCIYEETDSTKELLTQELDAATEFRAVLVWVVTRYESYRNTLSALSAGLRRDAWKQLESSADQMGTMSLEPRSNGYLYN